MLHTITEIKYRAGTAAAILPRIVVVDKAAADSNERRRRVAAEQALDQILADSFPASDPPSWNPGIAVVNPAVGLEHDAEVSKTVADSGETTRAIDIIDVSRPSGTDRTFLQSLVSLGGAAVIALLVPVVILMIGVPIAFAVRGVLELFELDVRRSAAIARQLSGGFLHHAVWTS